MTHATIPGRSASRQLQDARIEKRASFAFVRYANCWEDADILCEALNVGPGKRVLSIASAGDNTLALLAEGAEVVAADISAPQLACLELRCAAFRHLDYPELLEFLGVRPSGTRLATYSRLEHDLSAAARQFWQQREAEIHRGIVHCGKLEHYFQIFRRCVLPLIHSRRTVARLFEEKDLSAQRDFWDQYWNNRRWRLLFSIFFGRWMMGRMGRDPEFFRYAGGTIADRILERTRYGLTEVPTHSNTYLDYIANGNFIHTLPRYLQPHRFEAVREGIGRLTIDHGPIEVIGRRYASQGYDAFNLSDIFEYLDVGPARELYRELIGMANPKARLAYWNTFVDRRCGAEFSDRVQSLSKTAQQLLARDRAFFYSAFWLDEVTE